MTIDEKIDTLRSQGQIKAQKMLQIADTLEQLYAVYKAINTVSGTSYVGSWQKVKDAIAAVEE